MTTESVTWAAATVVKPCDKLCPCLHVCCMLSQVELVTTESVRWAAATLVSRAFNLDLSEEEPLEGGEQAQQGTAGILGKSQQQQQRVLPSFTFPEPRHRRFLSARNASISAGSFA